MSNEDELLDYPLKVTLKGDGAAPWITAAGRDGATTAALLNEVGQSGLMQAAAEASALLSAAVRAVNGFGAAGSGPAAGAGGHAAPAGGLPSPGPQAASAPAAPSYNQSPQYAPQPPPAQSFNGAPHPEGLHCSSCGAPVIGKVTTKGSKLWTCPNQAAKGDGHYTKWLN